MKYFILTLSLFITLEALAELPIVQRAQNGCTSGISKVIKQQRPDFKQTPDGVKAINDECASKVVLAIKAQNKEEMAAMMAHPEMYGCGLGAGMALKTVLPKAESQALVQDSKLFNARISSLCSAF